MNWYNKIIIAQIDTSFSDSFVENIKKMYELEYKRHAIINFSYNPAATRRMEIILRKIDNQLPKIINMIKGTLLKVFESWLDAHAILNPALWAEQRIKIYESEPGNLVHSCFYEYQKYCNPQGGNSSLYPHLVQFLINNYEQISFMNQFVSNNEYDYKNNLYDELSYNLENFNDAYGTNFKTNQEAELYIDNLSVDNYDLFTASYPTLQDIKLLLENNVEESYEVLKFIYQNYVFQCWYDFWSNKGIDETRERVENTYNQLKQNTGNLSSELSNISLALNEQHQNGQMLEYLEQHLTEGNEDFFVGDERDDNMVDNIGEFLTDLTDGKYNEQWNQELKNIGIEIPEEVYA